MERVSATIDCDLNYLRALYAVIGGWIDRLAPGGSVKP